jgi:glycerol-3-phosphate dehydrogenase
MNRQETLDHLRTHPEVDVLIIGGGINGVGTFRELALQGVRVLLAEKEDFCAGASAGSSHMLHGGIRYLENAEFRLVREALHERNLMLKNAPHYAKPLPTTIPIFKWWSGLLNAPLKFLNLTEKPAERGGVVIKLGLMMYDAFTGSQQTMPFHKVYGRDASLKLRPQLSQDIVCTATYYDAWMPYPERIVVELIQDAEAANEQALALNYLRASDGAGDTVTLTDELTGTDYVVKPKVVINAAGPWIDFVNEAMGEKTRFIGGTKGSHLILDNPELYAATAGHEIFFENNDGRIVLILPYLGRVMVGTTDIRIDDPEQANCTDDEIAYMLNLVSRVFPNIRVNADQIVFKFTGVRPLPASDKSLTGTISRDHSIRSVPPGETLSFPVHSLIGGKWTTWRAFSAQTADVALSDLGNNRQVHTERMPIGGGENYPTNAADRDYWLQQLQHKTELPLDHLQLLFERYGTNAAPIADFISAANDTPLKTLPDYSQREIIYLTQHEKIQRTSDFLLRRSLVGMLGYTTHEVIAEVAALIGKTLGWDDIAIQADIQRTQDMFQRKHGLR